MLSRQFSIIQKVFFCYNLFGISTAATDCAKISSAFPFTIVDFVAWIFIYIYNIICQMSPYKHLINYDLCRFFVVYVQFPDDGSSNSEGILSHLRPSRTIKDRKFIKGAEIWYKLKKKSYPNNSAVTSPWQFNGVKNFSYFCHVLIALCCLSSFFFLLYILFFIVRCWFYFVCRWVGNWEISSAFC